MAESEGTAPADASDGDRTAVPWAGWRVVLDAILIYLGSSLVTGVIVIAAAGLSGSGEDVPLALIVLVSPLALLLATLAWLAVRYGRAGVRAAVPHRWAWPDVAFGAGVGVACFVGQRVLLIAAVLVLQAFGYDLPPVQETFRVIADNPATAPVLVLTAIVLAPVAEELLFRGVVFRGIRARTGFWVAALASAALFTLAHLGDASGPLGDAVIVAGILPLGLAFAALMEHRRSLVSSMVAHGVVNGGTLVVLFASGAV